MKLIVSFADLFHFRNPSQNYTGAKKLENMQFLQQQFQ